MTSVAEVKRELRARAHVQKAADLERFFQTNPGGYGEGDRFLGLTVPQVRDIAKNHSGLSELGIHVLAQSSFHEDRFCALAILTKRFEKSNDAALRTQLWKLYLELLDAGAVNNWDLVDATAPYFGTYLLTVPHPTRTINSLTRSSDLWHQRVGVMVTWAFIKNGDLAPTLMACQSLLTHPHDLIHKACGWMLREVGKKDITALREFLQQNAEIMPRTMLRYAIEKMSPEERAHWLAAR